MKHLDVEIIHTEVDGVYSVEIIERHHDYRTRLKELILESDNPRLLEVVINFLSENPSISELRKAINETRLH